MPTAIRLLNTSTELVILNPKEMELLTISMEIAEATKVIDPKTLYSD